MQVKQQRDSAVKRRDLLQDVARALKHKFPAMRISDQPCDFQPAPNAPGTSAEPDRLGRMEPDGSSVHTGSYMTCGPAKGDGSATVLRDVINNAVAVGSAVSTILPASFRTLHSLLYCIRHSATDDHSSSTACHTAADGTTTYSAADRLVSQACDC